MQPSGDRKQLHPNLVIPRRLGDLQAVLGLLAQGLGDADWHERTLTCIAVTLQTETLPAVRLLWPTVPRARQGARTEEALDAVTAVYAQARPEAMADPLAASARINE